jgi:hypothetical protein
MHLWLDEWVPGGSKVQRVGGLTSPDPSRELVGWRIEFPDGVVCRASFWTSEVEGALEELCGGIRELSLLRGKGGNMRIALGGVMGSPAEWGSWEDRSASE